MAILAECPVCRRKQANGNRICACGFDLLDGKRKKQVRFWITYRLPGGKQRKEYVGTSIEEAKDAEGKRRAQKREGRIFDMLPGSNITFSGLADWYLKLEKIKALKSFWLVELTLKKFNVEFGDMPVNNIKPADLENYQAKRLKAGIAPATVDHEIGKTRAMVYKAFDNDLVSGDPVKAFKRVKKVLRPGEDVRDRILTAVEFRALVDNSADHLKPILLTAYLTGMRKGEILGLTWARVDLQRRVIRLEAAETKDHEARTVPICLELHSVLSKLPGRIHGADDDDHVFQYRGAPVRDIRTGLKVACKGAGISYGRFEKGGFVFHDLRHTFNTNLRRAGVAESVIMSITGHSTREMFDRYNTIDGDDATAAAVALERYLQTA